MAKNKAKPPAAAAAPVSDTPSSSMSLADAISQKVDIYGKQMQDLAAPKEVELKVDDAADTAVVTPTPEPEIVAPRPPGLNDVGLDEGFPEIGSKDKENKVESEIKKIGQNEAINYNNAIESNPL